MNNNLLKTADAMAEMATIVVATFEKDIAQGYKTRDKRYAIDMLKPFVSAYEAAKREVDEEQRRRAAKE